MGGWLVLIAAPRWRYGPTLVTGVILPLLFAALYTVLMALYWGSAAGGGFGSIAEVRALFEVPGVLLAGWIHYLAFDLFIGSWEVRDAQERGISHWLVIPCLLFTFMLGPVGLGCYLILRAIRGQGLVLRTGG